MAKREGMNAFGLSLIITFESGENAFYVNGLCITVPLMYLPTLC